MTALNSFVKMSFKLKTKIQQVAELSLLLCIIMSFCCKRDRLLYLLIPSGRWRKGQVQDDRFFRHSGLDPESPPGAVRNSNHKLLSKSRKMG